MANDEKKWIEVDSHSEKKLEEDLQKANEQLADLDEDSAPVEKAKLVLARTTALVGLNRNNPVWEETRPLLDIFLEQDLLDDAVHTCDMLYQSHQADSIKALVHGTWLSVSFPVDPALTMTMLSSMVDEMPKDSDGAALAATTAHYIAGIRANENEFENMNFFTTNLLANVAANHSQVNSQEGLNWWMKKLELDDPSIFIPRLGAVLNVIVPESEWWFDRDYLRHKFPQ